jgi:iduronate 2-sulfatase
MHEYYGRSDGKGTFRMMFPFLRALVLFALVLIVVPLAGAAEPGRPNVLLLFIDDLRPALGCYGDPVAVTPHIDRLAKRSVVFERAYCQLAVCSPSRASIMTGLRPDACGVWDLQAHFRETVPDVVTLPQCFKEQGYHTASIGKIYHDSGRPSRDPPSWSVSPRYDRVGDPQLRYATPENLAGKGLKRNATESADVPDETYVDGLVCQEACRTLAKLGRAEQPFFLAVGFRKPHLPFCAPSRYWQLYQPSAFDDSAPLRHPELAPELATRPWRELEGYRDIADETPGGIDRQQRLHLRHGYYACVSYVDSLVGRVLKQLEASNQADNTIVVLLSDHGFHLGEQGLWTKCSNYELATRVPLIIHDPRSPQARGKRQSIVELVDIYPTLAELCSLEPPSGLAGQSLGDLLTADAATSEQVAFSQFPRAKEGSRHRGPGDFMGYALRTDRYRYVEWRALGTGEVVARELYDLAESEIEVRNIATEQGSAAIVADLSRRLDNVVTSLPGAAAVGD